MRPLRSARRRARTAGGWRRWRRGRRDRRPGRGELDDRARGQAVVVAQEHELEARHRRGRRSAGLALRRVEYVERSPIGKLERGARGGVHMMAEHLKALHLAGGRRRLRRDRHGDHDPARPHRAAEQLDAAHERVGRGGGARAGPLGCGGLRPAHLDRRGMLLRIAVRAPRRARAERHHDAGALRRRTGDEDGDGLG